MDFSVDIYGLNEALPLGLTNGRDVAGGGGGAS